MVQQRIEVGEVINDAAFGKFQLGVFCLCATLAFLDGYDLNVVSFAAPVIAKAWGLPVSTFGSIFTAGIAGLLIGTLALAYTADRFGRKVGITIALALVTIAQLTTPLAQSLGALLIIRFVTGLGIGALAPNIMTLSTEFSPKRTRARAVTFMTASVAIGGTVGGFVAARMIPSLGWQSVFLLGGGLTLVLIPLVVFGMPESLRFLVLQGTERARIARLLGRIAPERSFSPDAEYVLNEERGGVPVISLFTGGRAAKTAALWVAFFSTQLVVFFATSWLTAVFNQHGLTIPQAITASSWFLAGGILGPMASGWLSDHWKPIAVVSGFEFVAAILIALLGPSADIPAVASITAFMAGFCLFGSLGGVIAIGASVYPTAMRSTGLGWLSGTGRVGALVGAQLGGVLLATGMQQSQLFYIFAIPPLIAVGALVMLDRVQRAPNPEAVAVN